MGKHRYENQLGMTYGFDKQLSTGGRHRRLGKKRDWTRLAAINVLVSMLLSLAPSISLSGINLG